MRSHSKPFAVLAVLIALGSFTYAHAAPYYTYQPTLLPQSSNNFDIGTSTDAWRTAYITQLCLSGDCRTLWPSGGGGSSASSTLLSDTNTFSGHDFFNNSVGIGTTSPYGFLSVNPTAALGSAPAFVIGSSSATQFVVTTAGNVGINTAAPVNLPGGGTGLTIGNSAAIGGSLGFIYSGAVDSVHEFLRNTGSNFLIGAGGVYPLWIGGVHTFYQGAGTMEISYTSNTAGVLQLGVGGTANNNATLSLGEIGIGTTTPDSNLTVVATSTNPSLPFAFSIASSTNGTATTTNFSVTGSGNTVIGGTLTAPGLTTGTGNGALCATSGGLIEYSSGANCVAGGGGASFGQTLAIDAANWISATTTTYGLNATAQGKTFGFAIGGKQLIYASSTNQALILGIGSGGQSATTSATELDEVVIGNKAAPGLTGASDTLVGDQSGSNLTSGIDDTAIGFQSFLGGGTASHNTAIGYDSDAGNVGTGNTAIGDEALLDSGIGNTAVGYLSFNGTSSGGTAANNVGLGIQTGDTQTQGNFNILLGSYVNAPVTTGSQQLNIGNVIFGTNIYGTASDSATPVTGANIGIGTTTPWAQFSINPNAIGTEPSFVIGSSTKTLLKIDNAGNITTTLGTGCVNSTAGLLGTVTCSTGTVTSIATNNGLTGTITSSGTIGLATINAGVLGAVTNGAVPTSIATSTLFGTGTAGQQLAWLGGVPTWTATTTFSSPLVYSAGAVSCATCLTANQSITLTGAVTGSGTTAITTAFGTLAQGILGNAASAATIPTAQATSTLFGNTATFLTTGNVGIASTTPAFRFSVNNAGSDFYIDSTGKVVARDTTNGWSGRLSPTRSFGLSTGTTTTWTASTTGSAYSPYMVMPFAGTLRQIRCSADTNGLGVNVQVNGSNATPSYFVGSTTVGVIVFTAGNTFSAGQKILANFGTTTTATTQSISCTLDVTENP